MSSVIEPPALGEATLRELRESLRGELVLPSDSAYDEARSVWNGMIDRRPALIAQCTGTSDVIAAIGFARSEGLDVAVRGGSHNVAGNATCDGGVVIDLSPMKGIRVDPDARSVRAQGGLTWGELDAETQAFGLATTGGLVTTTGVAGFHARRRHRVADAQARPRLRQPDLGRPGDGGRGRPWHVSETENAELPLGTARRAAGTSAWSPSSNIACTPSRTCSAGSLAWPAQAAGRDVLRFWRDWIRDTPDDLCTMAAFLYAPPEPFVPPKVVGAADLRDRVLPPRSRAARAEDDLRPLRGPRSRRRCARTDAVQRDPGHVRRRHPARVTQLLAVGVRRSR